MLVTEKIGNLDRYPLKNERIDRVELEWYETSKRIMHKTTLSGMDITMKFLNESQNLTQDDILYADSELIVVVEIMACDAIVVKPKNMQELATICYEIGNKHLPLFMQEEELLIAFEAPLYNLLYFSGYDVKQETRKLISPLKTSVSAHVHLSGESLFKKIMNNSTSE